MNRNYSDDNIKDLLVLDEIYELERLIKHKEKIDSALLNLEIDIIESALMYKKGCYKESRYIDSYRAYSILLKGAKDTNELSVEEYGNKVKKDIDKIKYSNNGNTNYLIIFLKYLIEEFTKVKDLNCDKGESKLYGLL